MQNRQQLKDIYTIVGKVGSGTYGEVHKAYNNMDHNQFVSVKMTKNVDEDKSISSDVLRELMILTEINFPHIIHTSISNVFYEADSKMFAFVYDYGAFDVRKLIRYYAKKKQILNDITTKSIMFQILLALEHIHQRAIMHCDVTPPNLIIMPKNSTMPGILKLIDFGLARVIDGQNKNRFTGVVTVWYRAPELLLGDTRYDYAVDIWAAGCIFAELMMGSVLFQVDSPQREINPTAFNKLQLNKITEIMGPLQQNDIARPQYCNHYGEFMHFQQANQRNSLEQMFHGTNPLALDLIGKMLTLNPTQRISARDALRHDYFNREPNPMMNISRLIPIEDWNNLVKIGDGASSN